MKILLLKKQGLRLVPPYKKGSYASYYYAK